MTGALKDYVGVVVKCRNCGGSLAGMRSHAIYCSRKCKRKASKRRKRVAEQG